MIWMLRAVPALIPALALALAVTFTFALRRQWQIAASQFCDDTFVIPEDMADRLATLDSSALMQLAWASLTAPTWVEAFAVALAPLAAASITLVVTRRRWVHWLVVIPAFAIMLMLWVDHLPAQSVVTCHPKWTLDPLAIAVYSVFAAGWVIVSALFAFAIIRLRRLPPPGA